MDKKGEDTLQIFSVMKILGILVDLLEGVN